jgi:hypothetical protein
MLKKEQVLLEIHNGPLNRNDSVKQLKKAISLLIYHFNSCSIEKVQNEKGEVIKLNLIYSNENTKNTTMIFDLGYLLSQANHEHFMINNVTSLNKCNELLHGEEGKSPTLFIMSSHIQSFTDQVIKKMEKEKKIGSDLLGLTYVELKAIRIYTQREYENINNFLSCKFNRLANLSEQELKELFLIGMIAVSAINKPVANGKVPSYNVFRGEQSKQFLDKTPLSNNFFFTQHKLLSTSNSLVIANKFTKTDNNHIMIYYDKVRGKDISSVADNPYEKEILFVNQTCFFERKTNCRGPGQVYTAKQIRTPNHVETDGDFLSIDDLHNANSTEMKLKEPEPTVIAPTATPPAFTPQWH